MNLSEKVKEHNGLSWVSDKKKLLYLGIPKTASTSMRHYLEIHKYGQKVNVNLNNLDPEKNKYMKFTVIRNPMNRFVSGIYESFGRNETPQKLKTPSSIKNKAEMLNKYLDILESDGFIETHTAPQSFYLYDLEGKEFKLDEVLIFENLNQDFEKMCSKYGFVNNLEHKQKNNGKNVQKCLEIISKNPEIEKRIKTIYSKDWKIYNKYKNGTK